MKVETSKVCYEIREGVLVMCSGKVVMSRGIYVICEGKIAIHKGKDVQQTAGCVIRKVKPETIKGKVG